MSTISIAVAGSQSGNSGIRSDRKYVRGFGILPSLPYAVADRLLSSSGSLPSVPASREGKVITGQARQKHETSYYWEIGMPDCSSFLAVIHVIN